MEASADGVSLEKLLEHYLLWDQAADTKDVTDEALFFA